MRNKPLQPRLRPAILSNASDAGANQLFGITLDIVTVTVLGFSATQVGLLNALGSLAFLFLSVPLGMLVDRVGAARVLAVSLVAKLLGSGTVLILFLTGQLGTVAAMVAVTVTGILTVASENAQTTIVPGLTRDTRGIAHVIATMASIDRAAGIIFPGVTGALIALWGGAPALALSTAFFALAVAAMLPLVRKGPGRVRPARAPSAAGNPAGAAKVLALGAGHGFAVLLRNRVLLGITLLTAAGNIGLAIGSSIQPILILRTLGLGMGFYGILGTVAAAAALTATFVAPAMVRRVSLRRLFGWGAVLQAVVAALSLAAYLWPGAAVVLLLAFEVCWAATLTVTNIAGAAFTANAVSATSLGRTSAAQRTITMGSVPLAAVGGGLLADAFGLGVPLLVWPLLTLGAAALFFMLTAHRASVPAAV